MTSSALAILLAIRQPCAVHSIEFTREARKALKAMPRNVRDLVLSKIDDLGVAPMCAHSVKKLVGRPGYRLRVGD